MKRKLTDQDWREVFRLRCLSKRGTPDQSPEARKLIDRAYEEDPERYSKMDADVFDATVPFGSSARWKR